MKVLLDIDEKTFVSTLTVRDGDVVWSKQEFPPEQALKALGLAHVARLEFKVSDPVVFPQLNDPSDHAGELMLITPDDIYMVLASMQSFMCDLAGREDDDAKNFFKTFMKMSAQYLRLAASRSSSGQALEVQE